jgi:hypothetical protein
VDLSTIPWGYEPEQNGPPIVNGRYQVNGESYTRVTNFAGTIQERFALEHWEKRVLAHGLGLRPDLAAMAAATEVADKQTMKGLIESALEAGGRNTDANNGSAIHGFCKGLLTGEVQWSAVPPDYQEDVRAYFRELERCGLRQIPELTERTVLNSDYETVGTFDIGLMDREGDIIVGDIKTGQRIDMSNIEFAIQFAQYNHARKMYDPSSKSWVDAPPFRTDYALVIHVPHGTGQAYVHRVNTDLGYAFSRLAAEVRAARRLHEVITPYVPAVDSFVAPYAPAMDSFAAPTLDSSPAFAEMPLTADMLASAPGALSPNGGVETHWDNQGNVTTTEQPPLPVRTESQVILENPARELGVTDPSGPVRVTLDTPAQAEQLFARLVEHGATGLAGSGNWIDVPQEWFALAQTIVSTLVPRIPETPAVDTPYVVTGHTGTTAEELPDVAAPAESTATPSAADAEAQELFDLYPTAGRKASLQTLARGVDSEIKINQHALNLAKSIVASANWVEHRQRTMDALRKAKAERKPGRKAKADDAPTVAPPVPVAPEAQPSQADVAAALGLQVDPADVNTAMAAPSANGSAPSHDKWVMPLESRGVDFYTMAIPHAGSIEELFRLHSEAMDRGISYPPAVFYESWLDHAKATTDITQAIEHSKASHFAWPQALATKGQAKWADLSAKEAQQ